MFIAVTIKYCLPTGQRLTKSAIIGETLSLIGPTPVHSARSCPIGFSRRRWVTWRNLWPLLTDRASIGFHRKTRPRSAHLTIFYWLVKSFVPLIKTNEGICTYFMDDVSEESNFGTDRTLMRPSAWGLLVIALIENWLNNADGEWDKEDLSMPVENGFGKR